MVGGGWCGREGRASWRAGSVYAAPAVLQHPATPGAAHTLLLVARHVLSLAQGVMHGTILRDASFSFSRHALTALRMSGDPLGCAAH